MDKEELPVAHDNWVTVACVQVSRFDDACGSCPSESIGNVVSLMRLVVWQSPTIEFHQALKET